MDANKWTNEQASVLLLLLIGLRSGKNASPAEKFDCETLNAVK